MMDTVISLIVNGCGRAGENFIYKETEKSSLNGNTGINNVKLKVVAYDSDLQSFGYRGSVVQIS